ncbi:MAG: WYL domain-containing protein [Gemmatimonadaceae bacterium]|nr:WYL domain-containing protein [Gemmatimonadaceae bacterium]
MTEPAAEQLRRVLHLLPHIANGGPRRTAEVAARAAMSQEELVAYLAALVERHDAPAGFVEGVQIYLDGDTVEVITNEFLRPMRLTMAELCALELGLAVLRSMRPPDEHGPIDRARARLRKVITQLPADAREDALRHAELASAGNVAHLATVRRGIQERRAVKMRYRSRAAAAPSARVVRPYGIVFGAGVWYVVGYCESSRADRVFRLDRIEAVELTDATFDPPPAKRYEHLIAGPRAFHSESPERMTVRYSPRIARWVAEREGASLAADGSLTLERPVADLHWAIGHVLQYGPDAEVLAPEHVRRAVVERLRAMTCD